MLLSEEVISRGPTYKKRILTLFLRELRRFFISPSYTSISNIISHDEFSFKIYIFVKRALF